ncbi:MAG: succinylglutamate desuccinylase/aspartoacylase family protein [Armatimonadetes bacterium]|nr:succinylglutamate desuccinylase/aspartoacylase family protein [Armatimonadota bacterium]
MLAQADGSPVVLRAIVARGRHDGPTLYTGAALHGDEVCGIEVIRRVLAVVDLDRFRGAMVAVPVQNPLAFLQRQRFVPGNAFDAYAIDVMNAFPGSEDGEVSAVLAHALLDRFIRHADYAVDLHSALPGGVNLEYCFTPAGSDRKVEVARRLARVFGLDLVIEMERPGSYVGPTKLTQVATMAGTPTFAVEFDQAGTATPASVEKGLAGFLNLFRSLGMLTDEPARTPRRQFIAGDYHYVRLQRAGMYLPEAKLGHVLKRGDRIGTVYDLYQDEAVPVHAPCDGLLYRITIPRPLNASERVAAIAIAAA